MTKPKIFVVDDDNLIGLLLENTLHRSGNFPLFRYLSGEECLANLHMKPDVVVLDYYLPGMNCMAVVAGTGAISKNDAYIKVVSVAKPGMRVATSKDGEWVSSSHPIVEEEKGTSLDFQIHKEGTQGNNNVCFYVTNQYGKFMPFFTIPIGGVPKYRYGIKATRD